MSAVIGACRSLVGFQYKPRAYLDSLGELPAAGRIFDSLAATSIFPEEYAAGVVSPAAVLPTFLSVYLSLSLSHTHTVSRYAVAQGVFLGSQLSKGLICIIGQSNSRICDTIHGELPRLLSI